MKSTRFKNDVIGLVSCFAFLTSTSVFLFIKEHSRTTQNWHWLFMYGDDFYFVPALIGVLLGAIGITRAVFARQSSALSWAGCLLNVVIVGYSFLLGLIARVAH